jgi:hypothetical protein
VPTEAQREAERCARERKKRYRSKAAANKDRIRINSKYRWMNLTFAYKCGDHWHLTSQVPRQDSPPAGKTG